MFQKDIKQVVGSLVSELDFYFENKGFARKKKRICLHPENQYYCAKD